MGVSLSLQDVSKGERSRSISHNLADWIKSFIDPVTDRFKAFEKWTVPVAGAMKRR